MRTGWRFTAALGFVGVVAMAAAAFGQVGVHEPQVDTPAAQEAETDEERRARVQECRERFRAAETDEERAEIRDACKPRRHGRLRHGRRLVTSEVKVQTDDGFATILTDQGTVTAVDEGAATLTIERADGVSVTVTASEDTTIRKGGERADLGDVSVGDIARIVRADDGTGQVVRAILVHAPSADTGEAEPSALRAA